MKRVLLANMAEDHEVREAHDRLDAIHKRASEMEVFVKKRLEDLKKAADDMASGLQKELGEYWDGLKDRLEERGILKDYDRKNDCIGFDPDLGVLWLGRKKDNQPEESSKPAGVVMGAKDLKDLLSALLKQ